MTNPWTGLWELAASGEEVATIEVDETDPYTVTLIYPDGSCGGWYFHHGTWCPCEELNMCPGDVAARDAL